MVGRRYCRRSAVRRGVGEQSARAGDGVVRSNHCRKQLAARSLKHDCIPRADADDTADRVGVFPLPDLFIGA